MGGRGSGRKRRNWDNRMTRGQKSKGRRDSEDEGGSGAKRPIVKKCKVADLIGHHLFGNTDLQRPN